jgi:hypothetical protein
MKEEDKLKMKMGGGKHKKLKLGQNRKKIGSHPLP